MQDAESYRRHLHKAETLYRYREKNHNAEVGSKGIFLSQLLFWEEGKKPNMRIHIQKPTLKQI